MCIAFCLFDKMSNKGNGTSYFLLSVFVWKFIQKCLPLFYSQLEIDYEMPSKQKVVQEETNYINFPDAVLFNSIKKFPTHTQQKPNCTLAKKKVNPIPQTAAAILSSIGQQRRYVLARIIYKQSSLTNFLFTQ